jgi:uncharacterized protein YPO0396
MNIADPMPLVAAGESGVSPARAGTRLQRCEIYNWGTFHQRVWALNMAGDNALLTGDIGSGKSTLVDALTTLLVPAQKISYNKAAGAEARERDLRSYVLGHYKSERGEIGASAKPVALRDHNCYSVILGRFQNEGFRESVTLAQVFWFRELHGQPSRFYVVADRDLSIAEHFSVAGSDVNALRKRLRSTPGIELHDTFPPYGASFRRRFGIETEQAMDLFHQTVSMKSVGNLTDFVRSHMLEAFSIENRIQAVIAHFDNLHRAHEAVLKAKAQIYRLGPLITDCDQHAALTTEVELLRRCREALHPFFAGQKMELLEKRLENIASELSAVTERIKQLTDKEAGERLQRDDIKRSIADNGGDRVETLKRDIKILETQKNERMARSRQYSDFAKGAGLPDASDLETFSTNRLNVTSEIEAISSSRAELQNKLTDETVAFRELKESRDGAIRESDSLRKRRSNIPSNILAIRDDLCRDLRLDEGGLPFAGELIEVRQEDRAWEGAAERLLRNFAMSLLVSDDHYARVAEWVDRTHLRGRLVYYRVRTRHISQLTSTDARSLVRKLAIRPDSAFFPWLEFELARRFNYVCADTMDEFRRQERALTQTGQIKGAGERHEKDDRHRLDDRTRYVLGWSNESKIAALQEQARSLEIRMGKIRETISNFQKQQRALDDRLGHLRQLSVFETFRDIDWRPNALEIKKLTSEVRQIEEGSDILRTLHEQLAVIDDAIKATEGALDKANEERVRLQERRSTANGQLNEAKDTIAKLTEEITSECFPRLEKMRSDADHRLTVESCDSRERDMRDRLQSQIDNEDKRITRLQEKIIAAMAAYRDAYPSDTRDADATLASAPEYRKMLHDLEADGLPRFEARFKELLNENTIREIANFQSQLGLERQSINERIDKINRSLLEIDYNPNRYIVLEATPTPDSEIRDFQQDLRACTEGALTGSEGTEYSESKFLQVKNIIERFRGREGTSDADRRWTRKVTDVRNWFSFSASERWREDNREHEHYTDSGGKSGGQKEKLAYTVLAASLAYQFGLDWRQVRSRSFRFVLIDEAFGRGSDESTRYGLELFKQLNLQLLVVTPLQKINIIEPYVTSVGFVHNDAGSRSLLRNLTIEEYRAERALRSE